MHNDRPQNDLDHDGGDGVEVTMDHVSAGADATSPQQNGDELAPNHEGLPQGGPTVCHTGDPEPIAYLKHFRARAFVRPERLEAFRNIAGRNPTWQSWQEAVSVCKARVEILNPEPAHPAPYTPSGDVGPVRLPGDRHGGGL